MGAGLDAAVVGAIFNPAGAIGSPENPLPDFGNTIPIHDLTPEQLAEQKAKEKVSLEPTANGKFVTFSFVRLDLPLDGEPIVGQMPITDYTEHVSTAWARIPIPGRKRPLLQWSGGSDETRSFTAYFFAAGYLVDLMKVYGRMKDMTKKDERLGRPPRYRFAVGEIETDCVVESVGGVSIERWWDQNKNPRDVSFNVSLVVLDPDDVLQGALVYDPTKPQTRSYMRRMTARDTYETLAQREFNSPLLGVLMRQDEDLAFPPVGHLAHVPRAGYYADRNVVPKSVVYASDATTRTVIQEVIDERTSGLV